MKGLFVSGSGTDVGKTYVALLLIKILNKKYTVRPRKPIESDCIKSKGGLIPKDATLLAEACNSNEPLDHVCRFRFESCSSPEKASNDEGVTITLSELKSACQSNTNEDYVIVEGAGGLYSPIARELLNSELAQALGLPVVLVVKDELGAINQALMSVQAAKAQKLEVAMIVLNQIVPNSLDNKKAISSYTNVPVVALDNKHLKRFNVEAGSLI
jgi:dethiobiotin synthetase